MTALDWCVVVLAAFYVIFAIDDLIFDVTYWVGTLFGWWRRPVVTQAELEEEPERRIALIMPAWQEADVIGSMLTYNVGRIDYERYDVWVGTYANDPDTQAEVARVRQYAPRVHLVVTGHDGPTSKADCLNTVIAAVQQFEAAVGESYDLVVMHDPEDIVHPLEFRLLNWFFANEQADFVQLPVFSTAPAIYDFVAGTYIDEFAEMYAKNMHVRQRLTPFVPSAGVATGVRRSAIAELVEDTGGLPFATNSLTEDYDLGLKMAIAKRKTRYLPQLVRMRLADGTEQEELIATWAPFPHTFGTAVRQRTRWMAGIVYQGWEHWRWPGSLGLRWVLAHDRRGPFGYVVVLFGYLLVLSLVGYTWIRTFYNPDLPAVLAHPLFRVLFAVGLLLMLNRLLQRAIAVWRFYGPWQALVSVVRVPFSNLVNMVAAFRATWQYWQSRRSGIPLAWDKTEHAVPQIVQRNLRLGERLVLSGQITPQQLMLALGAQREYLRPIGEILVQQGAITDAELRAALES